VRDFTQADAANCGQLWRSDGTSAGTNRVATLPQTGTQSNLTAVGSRLFFTIYSIACGTSPALTASLA
jgi:ELWxxDGT repeat protein